MCPALNNVIIKSQYDSKTQGGASNFEMSHYEVLNDLHAHSNIMRNGGSKNIISCRFLIYLYWMEVILKTHIHTT